ncbi:MAG: hypothetical protein KAS40_05485, partial [Desulfobacterales bacterium]|nr:hypothetical protein [Desulfobacterales bacterium]
MTKTIRIRKRLSKRLRYSLCAGLIFFILPLACNGQNGNNNLKSKNKNTESNIRRADQTGISQPQGQQHSYVLDEVLVKFKPGTGAETIEHIRTALKLETMRKFTSPNLFLMKITDGSPVEAVIEQLKTYQAV